MKILDIGCGKSKVPNAIGLDCVDLPGVDIVHDMDKYPYPLDPDSFDVIHANMVLEHLKDVMKAMTEIHRLLKMGGAVKIRVPYYTSIDAYADPTHKNFFTEKTFLYFTNDFRWNFYTETRFELVKLELRNNASTTREKIRNLIPFKGVLKFFLNNMYDEIYVELKKI